MTDKKLSNPASLRSASFLRASRVFLRGRATEHPALQKTRRQSRTAVSISQSVRWILICLVAIAGVALLSGCGQSEPQQPSTQQRETKGAKETRGDQERRDAAEKAWADALQAGTPAALNAYLANHGSGTHAAEARQRLTELEEQARRDDEEKAWADASHDGTAPAITAFLQNFGAGTHAVEARQRLAALEEIRRDEKAWADASRDGTSAAMAAYLQNHGSGVHVAEARQRLAVLEERARKDAEERAWADASRTRTAAAMTSYLQNFGSGNHALEARQRLSLLEQQERQQDERRRARQASALGIPAIDVRKTCQLSGAITGTVASQKDDNGSCIKSEQGARDDIVKQWAEFLRSERAQCMNAKVYLPSYVEWVTCLEMQRDVRKLKQQSPSSNAIGQGTRIRNRMQ